MKPLTLQEFEQIPTGQIFRSGVAINAPGGLYMTDDRLGEELLWVAKKGDVEDWAIYCNWYKGVAGMEECRMVSMCGQKIATEELIQRLVPCSKEVFEKYRM